MKNLSIFFFIVFVFNCKKQTNYQVNTVKGDDINFDEVLYLIEEHKQFELDSNREFYKTLIKASDQYYIDVTNNFLEKEYSMSGSFSELGIIANKSPEERFIIWEAKLNNYFSSLTYTRFIKSKTDNYSKNINKQRKHELEDLLNYIKEDSLSISKVTLNLFEASKESINLSITKSNQSINKNLKDLVYTTAEVTSLAMTGGTSAIAIGTIEAVGAGEMVYDFVVPEEDETKKILTNEYVHFLEQNNIDFTELLNKNTFDYYSKLLELIKKRKNEEICF